MFESLKHSQLLKVVREADFKPGESSVIDPVAAHLMDHAKIKTIVLDGRNIKNMKNAVDEKPFIGTTIQ